MVFQVLALERDYLRLKFWPHHLLPNYAYGPTMVDLKHMFVEWINDSASWASTILDKSTQYCAGRNDEHIYSWCGRIKGNYTHDLHLSKLTQDLRIRDKGAGTLSFPLLLDAAEGLSSWYPPCAISGLRSYLPSCPSCFSDLHICNQLLKAIPFFQPLLSSPRLY